MPTFALTFVCACGADGGSTGPVTVATVVVTAASATLTSLGATVQLQASAEDASGNTVSGESFTWASPDAQVATVSETGLVTAVANGTTTFTATTGEISGSATITVAVGTVAAWSTMTTRTTAFMRGVWGLSASDVYAVGDPTSLSSATLGRSCVTMAPPGHP